MISFVDSADSSGKVKHSSLVSDVSGDVVFVDEDIVGDNFVDAVVVVVAVAAADDDDATVIGTVVGLV